MRRTPVQPPANNALVNVLLCLMLLLPHHSNKDTVPIDHLDTLSAEERLTLFTNAGTLLLLAEIMVCWLFGEVDPLGK
jgi:hypothetical protein